MVPRPTNVVKDTLQSCEVRLPEVMHVKARTMFGLMKVSTSDAMEIRGMLNQRTRIGRHHGELVFIGVRMVELAHTLTAASDSLRIGFQHPSADEITPDA